MPTRTNHRHAPSPFDHLQYEPTCHCLVALCIGALSGAFVAAVGTALMRGAVRR